MLSVPGDASGWFKQAFDLFGVRVSSVRMNRGAGVAGAVATDIAIGSPPSEKMAKWGLDKFPQNDKTRAWAALLATIYKDKVVVS